MKLFYYLALTRPANVITAVSDIAAGVAIANAFLMEAFPWASFVFLILATSGLYAGGIVFNDVFDAELDKIERPERIIPSGNLTRNQAVFFGITLFVFAIFFATLVSIQSGVIAALIALFAVIYDKFAKNYLVGGPLTMGLCRGLNLALGMSILADRQLPEMWMMVFIPIVFVAAITLTSQGEVLGNNKLSITFALVLDILVAAVILTLGFKGVMNLWMVLPFVLLWIGINFSAKLKAIRLNEPKNIMNAVKMGVLSLIPLNASYVAGFSNWKYGLAVLCLLPVSILLAKKFSVT
jgi:4-hydroxybenzoate polyprenyltransferase